MLALLPPSPDGEAALVVSPDPLSDALDDDDFERTPLVDERSFFAQPEPLKWIAGGTRALRIVPSAPQDGQKRGPASWIPWITSTRCLQVEQM